MLRGLRHDFWKERLKSMLVTLIIAGLCLGSIYGLIALGYSLIYKASGLMNMAMGDLLTFGAFVGVTFANVLGLPFFLSLILTMVIMFFVGIVIERGAIRIILNKTGHNATFVILATIGISYVLRNGEQFIWGTAQYRFPAIIEGVSGVKLAGKTIMIENIVCIAVTAICMVALHFFMNKTRFGTAMRAAALDPLAAKSCGINVSLTTGVTWGIASGVAAIGGILIGPMYGVYTMLGAGLGRKGFASAVSGGYGNMYGAMVGGFLVGIVETLIAGYVSSKYKDMFTYGMLLLFLFAKPTGLFNEKALQD